MTDYADPFDILKSDLARARKRVEGARFLEVKPELATNLYPWLASLLAAVEERFALVEEQLEGETPYLPNDEAQHLVALLSLAKTAIDKILAGGTWTDGERTAYASLSADIPAFAEYVASVSGEPDEDEDGDDEEPEEVKPALASVPMPPEVPSAPEVPA